MDLFGDIERFLSEDLYPYRWPITIGLIVGAALLLFVALRLGWLRALLKHRALAAAIGLPILIVSAVGGWYLLSPLWERSYLEETSPLAEAAAMPTAGMPSVADGDVPHSTPGA